MSIQIDSTNYFELMVDVFEQILKTCEEFDDTVMKPAYRCGTDSVGYLWNAIDGVMEHIKNNLDKTMSG